ncbi:lysis system i-spanin subunit Rz [Orbus mooreae]|uniref:lysis system i-spanin subunit Rz n=1 Tax=Orbus mooreae TaxID=3074107 RepID=UPI00370D2F31
MSTRFKFILVITMTTVFGLLITVLFDIKNTYLEFGSIKTELSQVKAEFNQYQMIVQKVNDIDNKFTHNLANTKSENNNLYDNVINDLGRLQFNLSKAEQSTTSSMDDGVFCELTGEARQNYYQLR